VFGGESTGDRCVIIVGRSRSTGAVRVTGRDTVTGFRSGYIAASSPATPYRWVGESGGDEPVLEALYVESMEE